MNNLKIAITLSLLLTAALPLASHAAEPEQAPVTVNVAEVEGEMLYDAAGKRLAAVYEVTENGTAQIIYRGKMFDIPGTTLSEVDGKLTTSLTKRDLLTSR